VRESVVGAEIADQSLLTGRRKAISENRRKHPRCPVCLGPLAKGKKICSPRCRLVKWGARALLEAYREGHAYGLKPIIEELKKL
jgi:hypothetical protein